MERRERKGSTTCRPKSKSANRPAAWAKVDVSFGWRVAGSRHSRGNRRPDDWLGYRREGRHCVASGGERSLSSPIILPVLSCLALRTDATQSRPYPLMYRVGMSVLAQPRLTKGGQPYPLHSLPTCPPVNRSTNVASLWPTGQPVNRSTNVVSFCSSRPLHPHPSPDARNASIKQIYDLYQSIIP